MRRYHHLTIEEREKIQVYYYQGHSIRSIARLLGRSPATISRELCRNRQGASDYSPTGAQRQYHKRRCRCVRPYKLIQYPQLRQYIRWMLVHWWWSPEQVANRLRLEGSPMGISTATIYRAVDKGILDRTIRQQFRRSNTLGKRKTKAKGYIHRSIHQRPKRANERKELGHLEGDLVQLSRSQYILTVVDRHSRMLHTALLKSKEAQQVLDGLKEILSALPDHLRRTLTLDRGTEFAYVGQLETAFGLRCYFCDPHSPTQKGTNENTNGLIRQFFPKHSTTYRPEDTLQHVTALLNLRPRKRLNWRSPWELTHRALLHFT